MATKRPRGRDRRYSRTIGEPPFAARRYVENGKVRIEWKDSGKRRRRTIGPNDAETRRRADATMEEILARMKDETEHHDQETQDQHSQGAEPEGQDAQQPTPPLGDVLRDYALAALGIADGIADWVRDAITSPPEWEWADREDTAAGGAEREQEQAAGEEEEAKGDAAEDGGAPATDERLESC
ncbi:MAG: hypothetical protein PVH40_07685 [Gemmatimonadales bacterium]|jgi:hypothetical protein